MSDRIVFRAGWQNRVRHRDRQRDHQAGQLGRLVFGVVILGLGVLWLLDNMAIIDARRAYDWWPVLLIGAGIWKLQFSPQRRPLGGWILLGIGATLLAHNLGIITWGLWELWPVVLILAGGMIIWRGWRGPRFAAGPGASAVPRDPTSTSGPFTTGAGGTAATAAGPEGYSPADTFSGWAMWSNVDRKCTSQAFRGGDFTAFMGGGTVDLRGAKPVPGGAVVELVVVMGGVEVVVPDDWQVVSELQCVMGGVEDNRAATPASSSAMLTIRGFVLMGGVDILNHPDK